MTFEVDPDGLRAAAGVLALLPDEIGKAPGLDATSAANKLKGSATGAALASSDTASTRAEDVVKARFDQFSALLALCADTFDGTDTDSAQRLAAIGDLNSGDPHGGR